MNDGQTMKLATLSGLGRCVGCGSSLMGDISIDEQLEQLGILLAEKMASGDLDGAMASIAGTIFGMCPATTMTGEQIQAVLAEEYAKSPSDVKGALQATLNRACSATGSGGNGANEAGLSPWVAVALVLGIIGGLLWMDRG